ncbi:MAG: diiron oxygenase [Acidithiobacillales bacterium]
MLSHNYDYRTLLETSQRVNWKLEDVIDGKTFDFTRPFLPEALAGVAGIGCLSDAEKLKLNQIRAFTYLYLFGLVEEYILPSVLDHVREGGDDGHEVRALLNFAEEEAKHIQLFKWFVQEFGKGFGTPRGVIGPPADISAAILDHSRLGVFLATLHIEWMTQKHYLESVKDNAAENLDPLFCSLLRYHWLEESQHAKLDTLVVDKIASAVGPSDVEKGIDDYMDIGRLLDGGLQAQVRMDVTSLEEATGRTFSDSERGEIERKQIEAYRWTFLVSGMTHPNFDRSLRELSAKGHERVGELARAIA